MPSKLRPMDAQTKHSSGTFSISPKSHRGLWQPTELFAWNREHGRARGLDFRPLFKISCRDGPPAMKSITDVLF